MNGDRDGEENGAETGSGTWREYQRDVLQQLRDRKREISSLQTSLNTLNVALAKMQERMTFSAGISGSIGGALAVIILAAIYLMVKG